MHAAVGVERCTGDRGASSAQVEAGVCARCGVQWLYFAQKCLHVSQNMRFQLMVCAGGYAQPGFDSRSVAASIGSGCNYKTCTWNHNYLSPLVGRDSTGLSQLTTHLLLSGYPNNHHKVCIHIIQLSAAPSPRTPSTTLDTPCPNINQLFQWSQHSVNLPHVQHTRHLYQCMRTATAALPSQLITHHICRHIQQPSWQPCANLY